MQLLGMGLRYFLLPLLFSTYTVSAQLVISSGAQLSLAGGMNLTLENTDFVNNGNFAPGNGFVIFSGNNSSFIAGNQPVQFSSINIRKTNNASAILQSPIKVPIIILFTSGFLNLNGFDTDLGSTGRLESESETSHITGANGGQVIFSTVMASPSDINPGNLGAIFTSAETLGNVIIKRGHQSQSGNGLASSIFRYYDIVPANNSNLNAELKISYFDGELNNQDENSLVAFKSEDGINWSDQGFTSRNSINNVVAKSGINSFSRWTLTNSSAPLPVLFILFNAKCEANKVTLTWKTAQEQNSSHFDIERSTDGSRWTVIGSISATGNSNSEKSYSFTDNNPAQNSFYRIAEHDRNGRIQYTSVIRASCNMTDRLTIWPNPTQDAVFINIASSSRSQIVINVLDSKGSLVKMQKAEILSGNNQVKVDIGSLANGIYSLSANWNNGQMQKTVQVVKQ